MSIKEKEIARAPDGKPIMVRIDSRKQISKENKETYRLEKRMKELSKRGYKPENIAAMMYSKKGSFSSKEIEKASKNKNVKLDGNL